MTSTDHLWAPPPVYSLPVREIALTVNGAPRQKSDLEKLTWNIPELIEDLSTFYHLQAGDLIFTATPEGVGPVVAGDRTEGHVAGVGVIALHVGAAA
jgi:fumarylpyruvate hydrolase